MAEFRGYGKHLNQEDPSGSAANDHDFIDLTGSDDSPTTPIPSVSYWDNSRIVSPENSVGQSNSGEITHLGSETLDESLSIVYENIRPQPQIEVLDLSNVTDNIVVQLLNETKPYSHITKKVRIGSKSVNLSVSISTKRKDGTSDVNTSTPEVSSTSQAQSTSDSLHKPIELNSTAKIECGICLDAIDEITSSGRKVVSTICGHVFCCVCFTKSMANRRLCPKCRRRLNKNQVHPLYF